MRQHERDSIWLRTLYYGERKRIAGIMRDEQGTYMSLKSQRDERRMKKTSKEVEEV